MALCQVLLYMFVHVYKCVVVAGVAGGGDIVFVEPYTRAGGACV